VSVAVNTRTGPGSPSWRAGFVALNLGQFLAHQTALSFSALMPILRNEWALSASQAGLILGVFQLGQTAAYVAVGFLLDRLRSKPIMVFSAAMVGMGDLLFAWGARDFASGFFLRLLAGALLGGLYLPALKHIAETTPTLRRGLATGIYVGVSVAAYAAPLLYIGILAPHYGWRATMAGVGALELLGALVIWGRVQDVPLPAPKAERAGVSRYVGDVLANRRARRIIVAYTAHNWELFGMWGWIGPFMVASLTARGHTQADALLWGGALAAVMIGAGGTIGAVAGGRLADRLGRAGTARLMLGASLPCSLVFGWLFSAPLALVATVGLVYGIVVLADSPSYSATLMEVVPPRSLGGAFSIQMLFGWSATVVAPVVVGGILDFVKMVSPGQTAPWGTAFGILAVGPLVGLLALRPERPGPDSGDRNRGSTDQPASSTPADRA
jgi:MFS family permease